jgi:hypothetical protein
MHFIIFLCKFLEHLICCTTQLYMYMGLGPLINKRIPYQNGLIIVHQEAGSVPVSCFTIKHYNLMYGGSSCATLFVHLVGAIYWLRNFQQHKLINVLEQKASRIYLP